jgi:hypothetical protein
MLTLLPNYHNLDFSDKIEDEQNWPICTVAVGDITDQTLFLETSNAFVALDDLHSVLQQLDIRY